MAWRAVMFFQDEERWSLPKLWVRSSRFVRRRQSLIT